MKLMKSCIGIGLLVMSVGCSKGISLEDVALETRVKLVTLSVGMSKQQVISLMGSEIHEFKNYRIINKPFRTSMYSKDGDTIEIYYYFTNVIRRDYFTDPKRDNDELTPLVFINGKLDSWGWESWVEKAKRYDINVNYKLN